jgi:PTH1 family peptidyl-tRNA hydrolase
LAAVAALVNFLRFFYRKKPPAGVDVLIFGIGNPGQRYKGTRHNAGFMVLDCLARSLTGAKRRKEASFEATIGGLGGKTVALVKPTTFVNRCGTALAAGSSLFNVPVASCLVIADDFHLPLGTIRLKRGGSDGGHNGLASIIENSGPDFPRLRVGIGPLAENGNSIDFVLGEFTQQEMPRLDDAVKTAAEAAAAFCAAGIEKAMNQYNRSDAKIRNI